MAALMYTFTLICHNYHYIPADVKQSTVNLAYIASCGTKIFIRYKWWSFNESWQSGTKHVTDISEICYFCSFHIRGLLHTSPHTYWYVYAQSLPAQHLASDTQYPKQLLLIRQHPPHPNSLYTRRQTDTFTLLNNQWGKRYSKFHVYQISVGRIIAYLE